MLDLSFGLSIPVRDAALKMIAPGPTGEVNKQWYAQENERDIEEGKSTALEAYSKTDEKARELLTRLARSEPYRRRVIEGGASGEQKALPAPTGVGPIRTRDTKGAGRGGASRGPAVEDIRPPSDPNIASLFITGVEDDLAEHEIRTFFSQYGTLRSVVVSHRSHCGYINYQTRKAAEAAAGTLQGKAVIAGCPIRVRWGKPRKLDSMDEGERMNNLKEGRSAHSVPRGQRKLVAQGDGESAQEDYSKLTAQAPPGEEDVEYASLAGN
jgi:pre-mRNA-splicing factor RBM22/SLT11